MHGLVQATLEVSSKGKQLLPKITTSKNYKHWISIEDHRRCIVCKEEHGKIWPIDAIPIPEPPEHPNCRCEMEVMKSIKAGTATINGTNGADWKILFEGTLPDYYAGLQEAFQAGWKSGKWPSNFIPGKMITGGDYYNDDGHLPSAPNRKWYEADINYVTGKRNRQRIVWSNDGLVFVSYDHYDTFYEIVGG